MKSEHGAESKEWQQEGGANTYLQHPSSQNSLIFLFNAYHFTGTETKSVQVKRRFISRIISSNQSKKAILKTNNFSFFFIKYLINYWDLNSLALPSVGNKGWNKFKNTLTQKLKLKKINEEKDHKTYSTDVLIIKILQTSLFPQPAT